MSIAPSDTAAASRPPDRPRVLLADDYAPLHTAIARTLGNACEIVGRAVDGIQVVEEALRLVPDVVVMDLRMPGRNGLEACREIKSVARDVHVILLTAEGDDADLRQQAEAAGAAALIGKHRLTSDLAATIQALMKSASPTPE